MTSCYMNFAIIIQWIYFTIWKKEKKNCHHYHTILSLYNIISRHYKKSLLRSQIYHGYEELSTDTNYPILRRQERRNKYAVQLASWQLRSNSPKMSVCPSIHRIVSALYLQQYLSDPFHICTSYQATSEGVSYVKFVTKFKNLLGVSSKRRRSSCSSWWLVVLYGIIELGQHSFRWWPGVW